MAEEIEFNIRTDEKTEVKNPETNLYSWSREEVIKALANGDVDYFVESSTGSIIFSIYKFNDLEFGDEVRNSLIEKYRDDIPSSSLNM